MIAVAASYLLLVAPESGGTEDDEADQLLERIAADTTQGYIDDDLALPVQEARFKAGERLFISCGNVTLLAQRMLAEQGVDSRLVGTITREKLNGWDDGHTMLEVRIGGRWVLYDLANNRLAVDRADRPVSLIEQLDAGDDRRWRVLAHDRKIDLRGLSKSERRYTTETFIKGGLERWYDRVLGVPLIEEPARSGRSVFHTGAPQVKRYTAIHSSVYERVNGATWRRLSHG